jgi:hypothetical protein
LQLLRYLERTEGKVAQAATVGYPVKMEVFNVLTGIGLMVEIMDDECGSRNQEPNQQDG